MSVLYLLIPVALLLAGVGVAGFFWSVTSGQYDDVDTPAIRILLDEDAAPSSSDDAESSTSCSE